MFFMFQFNTHTSYCTLSRYRHSHELCILEKRGKDNTHTEKPVKEYLEVKMFTNDHLIIIASDNMHEYFIARTRTTTTMMMMMVQIVKRGRWLWRCVFVLVPKMKSLKFYGNQTMVQMVNEIWELMFIWGFVTIFVSNFSTLKGVKRIFEEC